MATVVPCQAMAPARILVADDEQNLRRVLVALLRRDGHEVVQAADGAEAMTMLPSGVNTTARDEVVP